jgi:hypothetical protein
MHIVAGAAQVEAATHCTHLPAPSQTGVVVPAHCAVDVHCTQLELVRSQCGAAAGHCESPVQPVRHLNSWGSQIGAAEPQSAFERQATHCPALARQRGAPAGQSVFAMH